MVCPPVQEIILTLKLVDYLLLQADNHGINITKSKNERTITVKILKFGTPLTIAIIVLKLVKFDVTLHKCIQKKLMQWQTA